MVTYGEWGWLAGQRSQPTHVCRTKTNIEHLSLLLSTFPYFVHQGLSQNMELICLLGGLWRELWESSCFCPPWPPSKAGVTDT